MPTAYIKKLADEGKGSIESLEKKWNHAKSLAKEAGHTEEFDYITGIFKKKLHEAFRLAADKSNFTHIIHMTKEGKPAGTIKIHARDDANAKYQLNKMHTDGKMNKPFRGNTFSHITKKDGSRLDESAVASIMKKDDKTLAASVASKAKGGMIPFHTHIITKDGSEHHFGFTNSSGENINMLHIKGDLSNDEIRKHLDIVGAYHDDVNESWDFESELKDAGQYADKKLKNKSKASIDADDSWTGSKHTQVIDKSFADKKPVGRRISGTYGTSYDPAADEEKPTKTTDLAQKKRGRPTGALGAAKKGLNTYNAKDAGRNLAQILGIKLDRKLMGKKPTTKHKLSDIDTSGIKTESTDNSLSEMTMGSVKTAAGKKVEWINHPGLGHSVSVNGVPAHRILGPEKCSTFIRETHSRIR